MTLCQGPYWSGLARAYAAFAPPLVPSAEDIARLENTVAALSSGPIRAVLLGVTPRIACMEWPALATLTAVDSSMPMIRGVWPGDISGRRSAVCANWSALPLADSSCDIVIGDGSFSCVRYPGSLSAVASELSRVLVPGGRLAVRCYIQAARRERNEDVVRDLLLSRIPCFSEFKLRLLMAMQERCEDGIAVSDVFRYWKTLNFPVDDIAARTGWDPSVIRTIELYENSDTIHSFPTLDELTRVLDDYFDDISALPALSNGGGCPIVVATARVGKPERMAVGVGD